MDRSRRINLKPNDDNPEPPEYLEDSERELATWFEDIWADSEIQARQICKAIGKSERHRLMSVHPLGRSGKRWRCNFRSYESTGDNHE